MVGARRSGVNPYPVLVVTMVLWGSGFSTSQLLVGDLPYSVAAFLRFGGGTVVLLVTIPFFAQSGRLSPRNWSRVALAGFIEVFAYNMFFFLGLSLAPSLDASTIIPVMSPILTTGFLVLTRQESASPARIVGLSLGLAGAIIFFIGAGGAGGTGNGRLVGDLLFLLSAGCWATFTLYGSRMLAEVDPLKATTYAMLAGSILLGLFCLPAAVQVDWSSLSVSSWSVASYVAVGPTAVAYLLYLRGVRALGPASATTMMFLVPVFGTLCSFLFLKQTFGRLQAIGALILLGGAVLAVTQGRFRMGMRTTPATVSSAPPQ